MHFLLLILLAPFGVLFTILALAVLLVVVSLAVEFPLLSLSVMGFALLSWRIAKFNDRSGVTCETL